MIELADEALKHVAAVADDMVPATKSQSEETLYCFLYKYKFL